MSEVCGVDTTNRANASYDDTDRERACQGPAERAREERRAADERRYAYYENGSSCSVSAGPDAGSCGRGVPRYGTIQSEDRPHLSARLSALEAMPDSNASRDESAWLRTQLPADARGAQARAAGVTADDAYAAGERTAKIDAVVQPNKVLKTQDEIASEIQRLKAEGANERDSVVRTAIGTRLESLAQQYMLNVLRSVAVPSGPPTTRLSFIEKQMDVLRKDQTKAQQIPGASKAFASRLFELRRMWTDTMWSENARPPSNSFDFRSANSSATVNALVWAEYGGVMPLHVAETGRTMDAYIDNLRCHLSQPIAAADAYGGAIVGSRSVVDEEVKESHRQAQAEEAEMAGGGFLAAVTNGLARLAHASDAESPHVDARRFERRRHRVLPGHGGTEDGHPPDRGRDARVPFHQRQGGDERSSAAAAPAHRGLSDRRNGADSSLEHA